MSSMFKYRKLSIRNILAFFFIITLSLPILIQLFANKLVLESYKDELILSDTYKIRDYRNTIDYYLTDIINLSSIIYGTNDYLSILRKNDHISQMDNLMYTQSMEAYFQQFLYRDHVRGVYLYSTSGQYYAANANFGFLNLGESLTQGKWIQSLMEKEEELFFLPTHTPEQLTDGFPVFSLVRKIKDQSSGKYIGLMLIDINPLVFDFPETYGPNTESDFFISDNNNEVVFHSNPSIQIQQIDPIYQKDMLFDETKNFILRNDTETSLVTYTSTKIANWNIYVETPLKTLEEDAIIISRFILVATLIAYAIAIGISLYFSKQISAPIAQITNYMKEVESGHFETHPPLENNSEIYTLSNGFNAMIRRIEYLLHNEVQINILKKEADFKALQAQINPHFLYNTLETISSMSDMKKNAEISRTCIVLSNMFRYSIGIKDDIVPFRYEKQHVQNYISIMQLRYEHELNIDFQVHEDWDMNGIFKLTLQPIVENCIQHGFRSFVKDAKILIRAFEKNSDFIIEIEDNGVGLDKEKINNLLAKLSTPVTKNIDRIWDQTKHNSIGLTNIHLRYALLYGPSYGITGIENVIPHGLKVTLTIPTKPLKEIEYV